jgi:hypothetical protein
MMAKHLFRVTAVYFLSAANVCFDPPKHIFAKLNIHTGRGRTPIPSSLYWQRLLRELRIVLHSRHLRLYHDSIKFTCSVYKIVVVQSPRVVIVHSFEFKRVLRSRRRFFIVHAFERARRSHVFHESKSTNGRDSHNVLEHSQIYDPEPNGFFCF